MNKFTIETINDIMRCAAMLLVQIYHIHFKEFSSNLRHTDVAASGGNKAIGWHLSMCIYLAVEKVDMGLQNAYTCYIIASLLLLELPHRRSA